MRSVEVTFPEGVREFLRNTIRSASGNEVFFLARVEWSDLATQPVATVTDLDVLARGNASSVPAVIHRAQGWHLAIHNHPSGRLEPSDADMVVATELGGRSIGFAIITNEADQHYIVIPPFPDDQKLERVDPEEVRQIFARGGPLSQGLDGFETREGQLNMALEVTRALNEDRIAALEAGTGVGKSFAYLVPAILWAVRNRQKVVVSTGTINLQEQLTGKDLPLLEKILPVKFRFALIKGRGNYACKRKLEEARSDLKNSTLVVDEPTRQLQTLVEWAGASRTGSRSELGWIPPSVVWEQIMSETDKSLKTRCPHYSECFYYSAKRRAGTADIIVVNHHLLFADLAVRRETENYTEHLVIPPYRNVIFDEAHHLEDVASEYFGLRFSQIGIRARLARLVSTQDSNRGVIPVLARRVRGMGDPMAADRIEEVYRPTIAEVRERVEDHFHEIEELLIQAGTHHSSASRSQSVVEDSTPPGASYPDVFQLRYKPGAEREELWSAISAKLAEAREDLGRLLAVNQQALDILDRSRLTEEQVEAQSLELESFGTRLQALLSDIERFRDFEEEGFVRWVSTRPGRWRREGSIVEFATAPIRVGESLKGSVYDFMRSVVLTSATLSVAGKADFIADRLGLSLANPDRFAFAEYPSPFDYETQAITAIPTDFPLPESRDFAPGVPEATYEILKATQGRAFVLFTSYSLLKRTYAAVADRLRALGLKPVAQGEAPRSDLLTRFRTGVANVLFGTDSFWEGVDVKGRALECVILTRLPFRVPSEPVQEARLEEVEARGENSFTSFTVPQAVLKFKQGFGRLIRAQTDRGVVVVLDRRILTKPYGRTFLASLPETRIVKAPLGECVQQITSFFASPQNESTASSKAPELPLDDNRTLQGGREAAPAPRAGSEGPPW